MTSQPSVVYDKLTSWATANGATINPAVSIKVDPISGASFIADSDIAAHAPIVTCPMSLTLSYLNVLSSRPAAFRSPYAAPVSPSHESPRFGQAANIPFPSEFLSATPPHVLSRFLLVQQYLAGGVSFWSPYIDALPQPGTLSLPALWPDDDVELLDGTNLGTSVQTIRSTLVDEYAAARKLLAGWSEGGWEAYTLELYQWAYAIFTSRSFTPALVIPDAEGLAQGLPEGVTLNDFSLLLPLYDVGNHDMASPIAWTPDVDSQSVTLTIGRTHQTGNQIYNNYGNKTNTQLLLAYGFMIPESEGLHNDYVHLRPRSREPAATPKDYLLSLYPVHDQRSVLVADKLLVKTEERNKVLNGFSYVEDALVVELIAAQRSLPEVASVLHVAIPRGEGDAAVEASRDILRVALTGDVPTDFKPVLLQAMGAIMHQACTEMEKLEESDVELPEEVIPDLTDNQRLALAYRESVRRVLTNVIGHVDEEWFDQ